MEPRLRFTSGGFPQDLSGDLALRCGGCIPNQRETRWRVTAAAAQGAPLLDDSLAIAPMQGIAPH